MDEKSFMMQILHPIRKNPKGLNQRCVVFSGKAKKDIHFLNYDEIMLYLNHQINDLRHWREKQNVIEKGKISFVNRNANQIFKTLAVL